MVCTHGFSIIYIQNDKRYICMASLLYNGYRVFPGGKERPGRDADPSPPSSAVGHERVELYLYSPLWAIRPVQSLSACTRVHFNFTVELYLYSPYGSYGLYRASVPVQGCTLLYSIAIPLLPLWAVRPVLSLSACTRVHFTFYLMFHR